MKVITTLLLMAAMAVGLAASADLNCTAMNGASLLDPTSAGSTATATVNNTGSGAQQ